MSEGKALDHPAIHAALDALLDQLPASENAATDAQAQAFWWFISALGQGRGIRERYHAVGLEGAEGAVRLKHPDEAQANEARRHARYHQGILLHLLLDLGGLADLQTGGGAEKPSILPGNFSVGAVCADLLAMMNVGQRGAKKSACQILVNPSESLDRLRAWARLQVVRELSARKAKDGVPIARSLEAIGVSKERYDKWRQEPEIAEAVSGPATEVFERLSDDALRARAAFAETTGKRRLDGTEGLDC